MELLSNGRTSKRDIVDSSEEDDEVYDAYIKAVKYDKLKSQQQPKFGVWQYFDVADAEKKLATCSFCKEVFSYKGTSGNLRQHLKRRHNVTNNKKFDINEEDVPSQESESSSDSRSAVWSYYKCLDTVNKISACLICNKRFSYLSTTSHLRRHLKRKHPEIDLSGTGETKTVLISSNGQLYEIEETKGEHEVDDEEPQDTMDVDTLYLEEFEENLSADEENREDSNVTQNARDSTLLQNGGAKMARKRRLVDDSDSDIDSSGEFSFQNRYVRKKNDSLEHFGKYLVSLLKELPRELSNQFQSDFIKQIINAQLSCNSTKKVHRNVPSNGYSIHIDQERETPGELHYVTVQAENES
ncbi:uncharacterized protein LOC113516557 isoform X3 [Galleria mellonella]|uniref:Uncharacterized protein LOC113516557 isoform X3 n=1 Tax=Galleria mellonella TaxID=7137 RepID=A0A6J1WVX7_GALME|nr:uncharacterized protein LOC113516557 isoform X3 [Galleria mellonella]